MPVMQILSALEEEGFESPPHFTSIERKKFFALPTSLQEAFDGFRTPTNKVCFLIAFGYFKARRKFFGKQIRPPDVEFVAARYGISPDDVDASVYDKQTALRHQQMVLDFFGYGRFDEAGQQFAAREVAAQVRAHRRPKIIFLELVEALTRHKIALPKYYLLAELIAREINSHKRALVRIVDEHLTMAGRAMLDALLEKEAGLEIEEPLKVQHYRLTLLKKFYHSTKPAKIKAKISDLQLLRGLHREIEPMIVALGLADEGLRYYATSVIKAEIFQVSRRAAPDRYLHLIAFIAYQTFKLHDLLIDAFLQSVQSTLNTTGREHKELYYTGRVERRQTLNEVIADLDQGVVAAFADIQTIISSDAFSADEKLLMINDLLHEREALCSRLATQLQQLKSVAAGAGEDADYYALLSRKSLKLQNRVSDIVRYVEFNATTAAPEIVAAIRHFQDKHGEIEGQAPLAFLSAREQELVFDEAGKFRVSLYKALLFIGIAAALKAGTLNLTHSHKYRPLDDYLLPQQRWQEQRAVCLGRAELTHIADPQPALNDLAAELDGRYHHTNRHWLAGDNPLLKLHADGGFHLVTPKEEERESSPLLPFFPERQYVSLVEVLSTVHRATRCLDEFEHWQLKHRRRHPPERTFFAGIIGYGCDIGLGKIARVSKHLSESELETTVNWYFSLSNIQAANDRILRVLDRLELPNIYRRDSDKLHTSSDGQKFEVAVESLNANYSFKYFGQARGVTVYSFIDERHFLFHSTVISSAEREAAYVIDGLLHNEVVKSDIHSTDTHGYSEIIFAVTCLLGFAFAPRIKRLDKQRLYSFERRKGYEELGYRLLPDAYVDIKLIADNWDSILRFIATLRLRHATASQFFKRLNSYSKQHTLYRALKEFGKIPKSLFILDYVDDAVLRQSIEKQLNKIESAQKFSKAVSFGHNQEFIHSEKEEQEIAESCRRLIKNAIICWNYLYLSQKLYEAETDERKTEIINAVRDGSVVTWQHINLHGEYDFSDEKLQDSIGLDLTKIEGLKVG
jgi:TnpA family transposase